jgi:hypothetical protein
VESIQSLRADEPSAQHLMSHGRSAASWGAIIAGAIVAVAVSLVLISLGAGLGFASISPWPGHGVSATTFTVTTAISLIIVQWLSACVGGYLAGRLRTRWIGTHTHEVFFRDTAHGLVTWSLATVIVAFVAATSASSVMGGAAHAAAQVAAGGVQGAAMSGANPSSAGYSIDKLFRSSGGTATTASTATDYQVEAGHILGNAALNGSVPEADQTYLATLIAQKTGISQEDAKARVDAFAASVQDAQQKAKEAADAARKSAAEAAIYTALSMLIGAFIASVSAVIGGRLRDEHP